MYAIWLVLSHTSDVSNIPSNRRQHNSLSTTTAPLKCHTSCVSYFHCFKIRWRNVANKTERYSWLFADSDLCKLDQVLQDVVSSSSSGCHNDAFSNIHYLDAR